MQKQVYTDQNVVDEVERTRWKKIGQTLIKDWRLYVLLVPMLVFLFCFKYLPIKGILTAFKWGNDGAMYNDNWCGFHWVYEVLNGNYSQMFWRAFRNTFVNSMYGLIFGFPIPIILALLFSEIKNQSYRSFLQVCCYLPHFVSLVVVTQIIRTWAQGPLNSFQGGILYQMISLFDSSAVGKNILETHPKYFRPIYQISGIWESAGYGSIVYFAAILAISPTSYEAARIDGASKLQQIRYVTFPGMAPTLTIMLIMRIGQILNIGYEKIILLVGDSESAVYETSDVISTFVYRLGIPKDGASGASSAAQVGIVMDLFNAIIAMCLVLGANAISRRVSSTSLF